MEDSTLLIFAAITSVAGLVVLWFAASGHEPPVFELNKVSEELVGRVVTVSGSLENVVVRNSTVSAGFAGSRLKLFGFRSVIPKIESGNNVTVTGEVKEYKGDLEIVPSKQGDVLIAD